MIPPPLPLSFTIFSHERFFFTCDHVLFSMLSRFTRARVHVRGATCRSALSDALDTWSRVYDPVLTSSHAFGAPPRLPEADPTPLRGLFCFPRAYELQFPSSPCLSVPPEPASHLGQCSMKRCAHFKDGTGEGHRLPAVIKLLENSVPSARGSRLAALSFRCRASGWTLRTQEDPKMGCFALVFPFAFDSTDECR